MPHCFIHVLGSLCSHETNLVQQSEQLHVIISEWPLILTLTGRSLCGNGCLCLNNTWSEYEGCSSDVIISC